MEEIMAIMKRQKKNELRNMFIVIGFILLFLASAVYFKEKEPETFVIEHGNESYDAMPCLIHFCIDEGYTGLYRVRKIVEKYIMIECEGIMNRDFQIDNFDYYEDELFELCKNK